MKNEKVKIKIEIDFTYDSTALKIIKEEIKRYKEETGEDIVCKRLLWSEECFWEWNGKKAHSIAFYYLIELCGENHLPDNGEFVSHKDNCDVVIGWMPIDEIQNIIIYPEFLKKEIYDLDGEIKHFVSK